MITFLLLGPGGVVDNDGWDVDDPDVPDGDVDSTSVNLCVTPADDDWRDRYEPILHNYLILLPFIEMMGDYSRVMLMWM